VGLRNHSLQSYRDLERESDRSDPADRDLGDE